VKYPWPDPKGTEGEEMIDPPLPKDNAENEYDDDAGRDGSPFVIFDLSRSAGKRFRGHIEPGKPADSAIHEIDKNQGIPYASQSQCKPQDGGRNAEGNNIGQRIEIGPKKRLPRQTTSHEPIENIAGQREREKEKDGPEARGTGTGDMVQR